MSEQKKENFSFASSVKEDVWHPKANARGYEWWYFDALSDDGRDALTVIFLDNFIFSPRYNANCRRGNSAAKTFPALAFAYYRDGKPLYRALNEFAPEDFAADENAPLGKIGASEFKFESAPYGSGYSLRIEATLRKNLKLTANLEWLSLESDLLPDEFAASGDLHFWNLVVPRADVTGKINVADRDGKTLDVRKFRGTGYHDHNFDSRWLPAIVKNWQWGRAHFSDSTAVFYRYREHAANQPVNKLFLIKNNELKVLTAQFEESKYARNVFGLKYPKILRFVCEDQTEIVFRQTKPIDASFFYLRFLSEATLTLPDGTTEETFALTEHLAPRALKFRWLDWLVNMRIGRADKGAFLP